MVFSCTAAYDSARCVWCAQDNRRRLSECELSALMLGQDKQKRSYWVIARDFSRVYVEEAVRRVLVGCVSP